jgi:mucin-19
MRIPTTLLTQQLTRIFKKTRFLMSFIVFIAIVVALSATGIHLTRVHAFGTPPIFEMDVYATYTSHTLKSPTGVYFAPGDSTLYIVDSGHNQIDKFTGGVLSVIAGSGAAGFQNGPQTTASFNGPLTVTGPGTHEVENTTHTGLAWVYTDLTVFDTGNNALRRICFAQQLGGPGGQPCPTPFGVTTIAGNGSPGFANGTGTNALLNAPSHAASPATTAYFADVQNNAIRSFTSPGAATIASPTSNTPGYVNGPLSQARFAAPTSVTNDASGGVFVTDAANFVIRRIDSSQNVTTFAGSSVQGYADGPTNSAQFASPVSSAFNSADGSLYVADTLNNCIRKVYQGNVSTYAGVNNPGFVDGAPQQARFSSPTSLAIYQGFLYVADTGNDAIRRIDLSNGTVSTLIQ